MTVPTIDNKRLRRLVSLVLCLVGMTAFVVPARADEASIAYDGIDVSDHQRDIDWATVASDKRIKYVYIKATEGVTYQSRRYRTNLEQARKHGLKVGSYHFMRTGSSVHAQFENFRRVVKKNEQDLLPLIDIEVSQGWTNQQVRDSVKVFADLIEQHYGCKPMIYTSAYFYNNILGRAFSEYPLFIARYAANKPEVTGATWTLWQFSEKGRVPGISTSVDLSCFNKACDLHNILISNNRVKTKGHKPSDATEPSGKPADKPGKATTPTTKQPPKKSKQEEREAKKRAEQERKAKERAEKLKKEEQERKAKEERERAAAEKKKQEQAAAEKKKREQKAAAERKKKEEQARRDAEKKAQQQQEREKREQRAKKQQQQSTQKQTKKAQGRSQQQQAARSKSTKPTGTSRKTNKSSADND